MSVFFYGIPRITYRSDPYTINNIAQNPVAHYVSVHVVIFCVQTAETKLQLFQFCFLTMFSTAIYLYSLVCQNVALCDDGLIKHVLGISAPFVTALVSLYTFKLFIKQPRNPESLQPCLYEKFRKVSILISLPSPPRLTTFKTFHFQ